MSRRQGVGMATRLRRRKRTLPRVSLPTLSARRTWDALIAEAGRHDDCRGTAAWCVRNRPALLPDRDGTPSRPPRLRLPPRLLRCRQPQSTPLTLTERAVSHQNRGRRTSRTPISSGSRGVPRHRDPARPAVPRASPRRRSRVHRRRRLLRSVRLPDHGAARRRESANGSDPARCLLRAPSSTHPPGGHRRAG